MGCGKHIMRQIGWERFPYPPFRATKPQPTLARRVGPHWYFGCGFAALGSSWTSWLNRFVLVAALDKQPRQQLIHRREIVRQCQRAA
jgi:hypothetical protein